MTDTNFNSDIKQFAIPINKKLCIQDIALDLKLQAYNNVKTVKLINEWFTSLSYMGKGNLYQSKEASAIIYCLLSDACIIESINEAKVNIDLYDLVLDRFYQFDTINKKSRTVRIKIFPICNTLIIFDWFNYPKYKIYELYNTDQVKEYYDNKKIDIDTVIKDLSLKPKFCGDVNDLLEDMKVLSVNKVIINKEKNIRVLEDFMKQYQSLEKQVQNEYRKLINSF